MKKIYLALFLVSITMTLTGQIYTALTELQKSWVLKANRYEKNGWIYLHIEGAPEERGFQHGYLLAKEIKESIRVISASWFYYTSVDWHWLTNKASDLFISKVDLENLQEIDGIVEGMEKAGVSTTREEIFAYNDFLELLGSWWPTVKDTISPNTSDPIKESCSSFIATGNMTKDGKLVLGHNTWGPYNIAIWNIIIDIIPSIGHRIIMQSAPGQIHSGSDFFITDAGIVGSETTIDSFFPYDPKGIPEFVRVRRAMQDASSIEEWCEIMKKGNNGGYANSWLLGDIKINEIARFELGLKYFSLEKKNDGYFTGSNLVNDLKILRRETHSSNEDIKSPIVARKIRWEQLMNQYIGKIDIESGKVLLSDHYDLYLEKDMPSSRSICGHLELDNGAFIVMAPYLPFGAYDGKIVDAKMAKEMSLEARWGSSCGTPFYTDKFLKDHAQYEWMKGILKNRPSEPWTIFKPVK
jgi:hypothetical protein